MKPFCFKALQLTYDKLRIPSTSIIYMKRDALVFLGPDFKLDVWIAYAEYKIQMVQKIMWYKLTPCHPFPLASYLSLVSCVYLQR